MEFDPSQPFNNLPHLPPHSDIESKKILKFCVEARAALAELKTAAEMLPNPEVLINTLPLLEAKASSEIENIVTTTDKLFQYANLGTDVHIDSATKEALRYRTALKQGYEGIGERPLSNATAKQICSTILGVDTDIRAFPGTAIYNQTTQKIIYTPPVGKQLLSEKLSNWEKFLHSENDIDPLIKMAVGHYQFEAIHPFADGNGRTGRILNILYLIEKKLLNTPILYLSRYILKNKNEYYSLLLKVTLEEEWESWIIYMLKAIENTAKWTNSKIASILELMQETRERIKKDLPLVYSKELSDLLFTQPYCRISNIEDAGIAKRQTAAKHLKLLCEKNILSEIQIGRDKLFLNLKFKELLFSDNND